MLQNTILCVLFMSRLYGHAFHKKKMSKKSNIIHVYNILSVQFDRKPVYFNNKETGIVHDGLQLLMLHSFVRIPEKVHFLL